MRTLALVGCLLLTGCTAPQAVAVAVQTLSYLMPPPQAQQARPTALPQGATWAELCVKMDQARAQAATPYQWKPPAGTSACD
ncbi:MAG TPA: hypothetical protein PK156_47905 [Polyangium sp.]|nr:hypothetical protein [Polyangium sp.]